ncbi:Xaa-Pro dipeptidase [Roseovarius pacificus]|uniref:Xaa-Pro dipeptidase n=1 Tax=Roseovarius pacificus TaxID=337701 RepID=A0A1M7AJ43_9RHOB|nr:Xaa-Pro peptidase family protein [Roseovarius pacificus]GGO53393.1 Xaa-Pro dipeptidase [Roseovarius pacificus]SHL42657.1 Xaa-Pro dipeptidase [Roseovarius pacificus]
MIHFERSEFDGRLKEARALMRRDGLDALLVFSQESHYYLTGFDTKGFVFFQCALVTANDDPVVLLTRKPDLEQARRTSIIEDIRLWFDAPGADPTRELQDILAEKGLAGKKIGLELRSFGLTGDNHDLLRRRLDGWCVLVDASYLVRELRLIKSEAEIEYVRKAAELADQSLEAMVETAGPGVFEGKIAAAGIAPILEGGGDMPPSGPVLGSGDRALLVRSATGYRHLDDVDQLTIEHAGSYRHYCACLMRTLTIGTPGDRHRDMFSATKDAILAMTDAARSGNTIGQIDDAHRATFDNAGYNHARLSACGYSLGATYSPSWMDVPPMIHSGNDTLIRPGMILFLHAILVDGPRNLAMSAGYTILTREEGQTPEVLSRLPLELINR